MTYQADVISLMIASPGDVAVERESVREIIYKWNALHSEERKQVLLPIGWESHSSPKMGDRAQSIINKEVLDRCDILIGIFWTRLGSPTGEFDSGTVEEITRHIQSGKTAMLYFSKASVNYEEVDRKQYDALIEFKNECLKKGLVEIFNNSDDFYRKFYDQLILRIKRDFPIPSGVPLRSTQASTSIKLTPDAKYLLLEIASDPRGTLHRLPVLGGLIINTNGKDVLEEGSDPRTEARWKKVIIELEEKKLIEARSPERKLFHLTDDGYQLSDSIKPSNDTLE